MQYFPPAISLIVFACCWVVFFTGEGNSSTLRDCVTSFSFLFSSSEDPNPPPPSSHASCPKAVSDAWIWFRIGRNIQIKPISAHKIHSPRVNWHNLSVIVFMAVHCEKKNKDKSFAKGNFQHMLLLMSYTLIDKNFFNSFYLKNHKDSLENQTYRNSLLFWQE